MPQELAPGAVIAGVYRLDRVLGEGGMGVVWAARRLDRDERVAIKVVKGDEGAGGGRLLREARAAASVRHPHVVAVHEVVELDDGAPAIVMELLAGEPLADRLRREPRLPFAALAEILVPVVSAVGAAHAQGVIHRDLKPANVWLAPSGVKVLDFGIAKVVSSDAAPAGTGGGGTTTTGVVIGTPAYMAPEQLFGERDMDHRVDVWAIGLIAYQALTGVLPTAGESVGQILKGVLARPIPPLARVAPAVPAEVAALVDRMLSRDRDARPADLREVFAALLRHSDARASAFGPPARSGELLATVSPDPLAALPLPPPRRLGRVFRVGLALAVATAMAVVGVKVTRPRPLAPPGPASPLAAPASILACPIFQASGVDAPAGWLGAAASAMICDRARVLLGGRAERILVPAELLDLPREPTDAFPADPFAAPDARDRSLAAARARAAAFVDGSVTRDGAGFRLAVTLRAADGRALGEVEGRAPGLPGAVREAMGRLPIPRAAALDPEIAAFSRAADVDAALALLDVQLAMAAHGGKLADDCARLEQHAASIAEMGPGERWRCAYILGHPLPRVDPPQLDEPAPGPLAGRARVALMLDERADFRAVAARLREAYAREAGGFARSMLASTESCLVQGPDPERARALSLLAVKADPKNPDGQNCNPWGQLLTVAGDTGSAGPVTRAMQAWSPWNSNAWSAEAAATADPARALAFARRAYALSPLDASVADTLADRLLAGGDRAEARGVALALAAGSAPVHRAESDLLLVRIDASEARFAAALARARRASEITAADGGYVRVQRVELGFSALSMALVLGREAEIGDLMAARFLDPEPPLLDSIYAAVPLRAAAFCAYASKPVSRRCFDRLSALIDGGRFQGNVPGTDAFIQGARRFAERDLAGAARAWRPLLRTPGALLAVMPDAMAVAFEKSDPELAEKVDAAEVATAGRFNGASLAHARAARRAHARGDREAARAHAKRVIEAWSVADEPVPAVAEMRKLRGP
jgi:hypothetical protein